MTLADMSISDGQSISKLKLNPSLSPPIFNSNEDRNVQQSSTKSACQSFSNILKLDENEIEFLNSILPVKAEVALTFKSYGSCSMSPSIKTRSKPPKLNNNSHSIDESINRNRSDNYTAQMSGNDSNNNCTSGIENSGAYFPRTFINSAISCQTGSHDITNADGSAYQRVQTQHTRHHRRSISRGTSSKAIPFSLAVEEIGITAQVLKQYERTML